MKCSDKEWQHCNKEKMGCEGCFYNDKISIGEYVRTKDGRIETIKVINKYDIITLHEDDNDTFSEGLNWYAESGREINEEDILKHSKNIIDLIQKDDYVNGHLVIHKYTDTYYGQVILIEKALAEAEEKFLKNKDIKSVITAEQIKQIEFRIKE